MAPLIQNSKFNNFLWVCWFLGKNLSNFVSLVWKLQNPYCHNVNHIILYIFWLLLSFSAFKLPNWGHIFPGCHTISLWFPLGSSDNFLPRWSGHLIMEWIFIHKQTCEAATTIIFKVAQNSKWSFANVDWCKGQLISKNIFHEIEA